MNPYTKCQQPFRRADEQVEARATSCPSDGKLSLKADEPQVDQWHKNRKFYRKEIGILSHYYFP